MITQGKTGEMYDDAKLLLIESIKKGILKYRDFGFDPEWLKEKTEILIIRGIYGLPGKDNWDGRLDVMFLGVSIFDTEVQTWADATDLNTDDYTLKPNSYYGMFFARSNGGSGDYLNVIWLRGNGLDWNTGFLLHPDAKTALGEMESYGPDPHSEGCPILGLTDFNGMTSMLKGVGFEYKEDYSDKIPVNLTINPELINKIGNSIIRGRTGWLTPDVIRHTYGWGPN